MLDATEVARLRRSVAMLEPGRNDGLDRDTALAVLCDLEEMQSAQLLRCPHCGRTFSAVGHT